MANEIKLPELGENLAGGEVLELKVAVGDTVSEGQTLLDVEAEKSTIEVPAPVGGRISKILVKKGDQIKVGQPLFLIDGNGEASHDEGEPAVAAAPARRHVEERHAEVAAPTPPRMTPKPPDGRRFEQAKPAGQVDEKHVPAGPATRRLARELGIDIMNVPGTAPGGRVSPEDIKEFVKHLASGNADRTPGIQLPPLPDFERWGPVERLGLEPVRRRTAEQMSRSWSFIPHVTHLEEADITDLDALRREQDAKSKGSARLTVTAFALKATAIALKQYPKFNTTLDVNAGQLVFKKYYHIGVAVDTERGLLVPVLRDVDKKSIREIAEDLTVLSEKARAKKIQVDEMRGGTFTITNIGGIGGTNFTPLINYPEVAILGMSRARLQPVVRQGQIVPRLIMPMSVAYDHRVIDGADAARFTRRIAELLEQPVLMLL